MAGYLNPGGDGLWPAPEGTCVGYEYSSGSWRVPPGLTGARYIVQEAKGNFTKIRAEIDLINNKGIGIPAIFERSITVIKEDNSLAVDVIESIEYIGVKSLKQSECLLAPWSLCQFESGENCEVVFSLSSDESVWDLYESSEKKRSCKNGLCHTKTDGGRRYQVGLSKDVPWIEYHNPAKKLKVRRSAMPLPEGQDYIDIADTPPTEKPSDKGVSLSVYSDPSFFMEIEAVGGCPKVLNPGDVMSVGVKTIYSVG
jgi:hypothetical protein